MWSGPLTMTSVMVSSLSSGSSGPRPVTSAMTSSTRRRRSSRVRAKRVGGDEAVDDPLDLQAAARCRRRPGTARARRVTTSSWRRRRMSRSSSSRAADLRRRSGGHRDERRRGRRAAPSRPCCSAAGRARCARRESSCRPCSAVRPPPSGRWRGSYAGEQDRGMGRAAGLPGTGASAHVRRLLRRSRPALRTRSTAASVVDAATADRLPFARGCDRPHGLYGSAVLLSSASVGEGRARGWPPRVARPA